MSGLIRSELAAILIQCVGVDISQRIDADTSLIKNVLSINVVCSITDSVEVDVKWLRKTMNTINKEKLMHMHINLLILTQQGTG